MRKSGALLQEGRVMVDSRQPLSRNSTLLSLWNRQLNGVQVLMAERRSLSWENDSKSEKYENGKADGLMWATVPSKARRHLLKKLPAASGML